MRFSFVRWCVFLVAVCTIVTKSGAVGQSAVITLVFPPGARATGLGEAFTGLSDDANATYFNPAGLGQDPMSNTWKAYSMSSGDVLTSVAAKRRMTFGMSEKIWAGTNHGVLRFNGKAWESYERHLIVQGDNIESVAKKYLAVDNDALVRHAVETIKKANSIETNRSAELQHYLQSEVSDSLQKARKFSVDGLAGDIMALSKFDRTEVQIYGMIASKVDSVKANKMAGDIIKILSKKDVQFDDLVELKIPFRIAVDENVTAMTLDSLERVWIGTEHGLWRYDGSVWNFYSEADGMPSNNVSTVCVAPSGTVAVGTDGGLGLYDDGKWSRPQASVSLLDSAVTAIAYGKGDAMYVGTHYGLVMRKDSAWSVIDTSTGLLNPDVRALFVDSKGRLWVGGPNGVSIFDEKVWKRYKFPGSIVSSIIEQPNGTIWIGTDKGAVSFRQNAARIDAQGQTHQSAPQWKVFHSKNALKGDDVKGISVQGKDVWLATSEAVNKYDVADQQVMLFYEPLLPAFKIPDLWHVYMSYVLPTEDWGTLGLSVNYINFGTNTSTNEQGQEIAEFRSWEGVFGLSYGLLLMRDFSVGMNVKYVYSALAPGYGPGGQGIGTTFAIDAALLKKNFLIKHLSLGLNLQNMGPTIYYVSQTESDPIPFTVRLGLCYEAVQTPFLDLRLLFDAEREIVKNYPDKAPDPFYTAIWTGMIDDPQDYPTLVSNLEEINLHGGIELWYANMIALRVGDLFDYVGRRFELTMGVGIKYANISFDWSFIYSPEGFMQGIVADGSNGSRDGQWRASFIFAF